MRRIAALGAFIAYALSGLSATGQDAGIFRLSFAPASLSPVGHESSVRGRLDVKLAGFTDSTTRFDGRFADSTVMVRDDRSGGEAVGDSFAFISPMIAAGSLKPEGLLSLVVPASSDVSTPSEASVSARRAIEDESRFGADLGSASPPLLGSAFAIPLGKAGKRTLRSERSAGISIFGYGAGPGNLARGAEVFRFSRGTGVGAAFDSGNAGTVAIGTALSTGTETPAPPSVWLSDDPVGPERERFGLAAARFSIGSGRSRVHGLWASRFPQHSLTGFFTACRYDAEGDFIDVGADSGYETPTFGDDGTLKPLFGDIEAKFHPSPEVEANAAFSGAFTPRGVSASYGKPIPDADAVFSRAVLGAPASLVGKVGVSRRWDRLSAEAGLGWKSDFDGYLQRDDEASCSVATGWEAARVSAGIRAGRSVSAPRFGFRGMNVKLSSDGEFLRASALVSLARKAEPSEETTAGSEDPEKSASSGIGIGWCFQLSGGTRDWRIAVMLRSVGRYDPVSLADPRTVAEATLCELRVTIGRLD
jgi:hypothetical protein